MMRDEKEELIGCLTCSAIGAVLLILFLFIGCPSAEAQTLTYEKWIADYGTHYTESDGSRHLFTRAHYDQWLAGQTGEVRQVLSADDPDVNAGRLKAGAESDYYNGGNPVLVQFTASYCEPCQRMKPTLSALRSEGYDIRTVDLQKQPDVARCYRVSRIPATVCVVYRGGRWQELGRLQGVVSAGQLRRLCVVPKTTEVGTAVRRFIEP